MRRVNCLEKKGIKSVEDMTEEQFYCLAKNVFALGKIQEFFVLTNQPWCIIATYNADTGEKAEFYITREALKDILS